MTALFWILSIIFAILGSMIFVVSKGAIHEVYSSVLFLTAATCAIGAEVIRAINNVAVLLRQNTPMGDATPVEEKPYQPRISTLDDMIIPEK